MNISIRVFTLMVSLLYASTAFSQGVTKVSGTVFEDKTGSPMAFVDVYFKGTSVGTSTDLDGKFEIQSRFVSDSLCATFLGFNEVCYRIKQEQRTSNIKYRLQEKDLRLKNVIVVAKKGRYRKKNNPAVELMRKVIANKKINRLEGREYYSFEQHEKIQLDINNITEEFKNRRIFNSFDLLWDYLDTSYVNGKIYLPVFLREVLSDVYYRQSPESRKEYQKSIKLTKFDEQMDDKSINDVVEFLYKDIDIYDNTVPLLDHSFVSPISPLALNFYRFYILDTLDVNGINSIRLGFIPKNKANFGFTGDLYVSNDEKHAVTRADFGIIGDIHLNFVNDLRVNQDFEPLEDGTYILTRDELVVDYGIAKNGVGFYGTRTVGYKDFNFDPAPDPGVYNHLEKVIIAKDAYDYNEEWWDENRIVDLTTTQEDLYDMIDTLITLPAYKRLITGIRILTTGYVPFKKFDMGPLPTFYSYNQIEGSRVRMGFETNLNFDRNILIDGYAAYGFRDKAWKYRGAVTYSFNEDWKRNPRHYLRLIYQNEVLFPGQELTFVQQDNILLSFRRGATDKMFFERELKLDYTRESPGFAIDFNFNDKNRRPYGNLQLNYLDENGEPAILQDIETTTFGVGIEISPNKQFIQGRQYRRPIINEYPIWNFRYETSVKGLLGSNYSYHKLEFGFFKRFNMSILGHSNFGLRAAKMWGDVPYTELFIPPANQSFSYQRETFNMMNFLEFVSDQQVFVRIEHFFKGFFFNRIPLFKKLKLREVASFKMVYGSLRDSNNPNLTPGIPTFDTTTDDAPLTYLFTDGPYMEGSVGVTNIFRVLRLDLVKRFNYLDNPNVPSLFGTRGLGLRARFKVEF